MWEDEKVKKKCQRYDKRIESKRKVKRKDQQRINNKENITKQYPK